MTFVYGGVALWSALQFQAAEAHGGGAGYLQTAAVLLLSLPFNYVFGPLAEVVGWEVEFNAQLYACMLINFVLLLLVSISRSRGAERAEREGGVE